MKSNKSRLIKFCFQFMPEEGIDFRFDDAPNLCIMLLNLENAYELGKNILACNKNILKVRISKASYPFQGYYIDRWNIPDDMTTENFTENIFKPEV